MFSCTTVNTNTMSKYYLLAVTQKVLSPEDYGKPNLFYRNVGSSCLILTLVFDQDIQ